MDVTERIHCDHIIVCSPEELQKEKDKSFSAALSVKKLIGKFPVNYKKDPGDDRDFLFTGSLQALLENNTLPNEIDHTPMMSSIKNQGQLGSCVGFAVTAMKEWQEQQEHILEVDAGKRDTRKEESYDLSEAWLYWKAKEIDAWPGEEGTSIRYAMQVLNKIGVPTEKAWPYGDVNFGKPKRWASLVARWSLIDSYWRVNTLEELKGALLNGPVPIGVPVFYEFFYPKEGVISMPANTGALYGGHAICAVGYNDTTKLVKFKNSWGSSWGEDGYGYLTYDYIKEYLWDAWSCKDLSVTKEMLKGKREL